jgi:hypothetical protein
MEKNYSFLHHTAYSDNETQGDLDRFRHATRRLQTIPDFNIVRRVPLLIGQLVCRYIEEFNECFFDIANKRGFVLTAMYLYNAAKKSRLLQPEACWIDMEIVLDNQVGHDPFGGSPANTAIPFSKFL